MLHWSSENKQKKLLDGKEKRRNPKISQFQVDFVVIFIYFLEWVLKSKFQNILWFYFSDAKLFFSLIEKRREKISFLAIFSRFWCRRCEKWNLSENSFFFAAFLFFENQVVRVFHFYFTIWCSHCVAHWVFCLYHFGYLKQRKNKYMPMTTFCIRHKRKIACHVKINSSCHIEHNYRKTKNIINVNSLLRQLGLWPFHSSLSLSLVLIQFS